MPTPYDPTVGGLDATVAAGDVDATELPQGTHIGRYVITGVLGRSGMGVVYAAHDPNLDRRVALKLLHATFRPEHLVREAQALARLDDPHVVTVYDAGELDGRGFVAMQLVDGEDLATALASRNPSYAQIVAWFVDAGRGLAAAHAAGLVHRDFKPSNVLIDKRGRVAVTDFGLARIATADGDLARQTSTNMLVGTPAYMSPEQHGQEPATQASDQFSFCVALWEALFRQHPFLTGPRELMSPFAIGFAIFDGPLIPPPKSAVPRAMIDALTRGLARDPASRWPAMAPLLAALAPPPVRRVWPFVIGALVAAGAGGTAVWALAGNAAPAAERPSCQALAGDRIAAVWSAAAGKQLADRFVRSGRAYAPTAATQASAALDRYAARWRQLAVDGCSADQTREPDELATRKRGCLDARLDAMRSLVGLLGDAPRGEFVDHAQAMVDGLPDLADCTDAVSLLAGPGAVPAALADQVAPVEADLAIAIARGIGGDFETSRTMLAAVAARADTIGWAPLAARAHVAFGAQQLRMLVPARDELLKGAELATANHLDREAARAWSDAMQAAAYEHSADAVAALLPMARGAATRVGDPALELNVDITYGRALVRLRRWQEGGELCRIALAAVQAKLDGTAQADSARDCLVEALVPQGRYAELEPMLAELIAERSRRFGPDHPMVADFVNIQSGIDRAHGKLAEAHLAAQHVLDIRRRVFPPRHVKIAEALDGLASLYQAEDKPDDARPLYEEALGIALEAKPEPVALVSSLQVSLGFLAIRRGERKVALEHFEQAVTFTRAHAGPNSIELAILLLNYGQVRAEDNLEAGIGLLGEGREILERAHDRRAAVAGAAQGMVMIQHHRFWDARKLMQEALAHVDADVDPEHVGDMKFALAQALVETKGDRKLARTLATEAAAHLAKVGPTQAEQIKEIEAWLAKHR